jgi:XTP/dITP diphosphohydrolase
VSEASRSTLLLATRNPKKLAELARILSPQLPGAHIIGLDSVPVYPEPRETEASFEGNALLKARAATAATGLFALADDSGLCVDALNGMPGVLSARWSGQGKDDAANNALLLAQLADVPDSRRGAAFRCAAALCGPGGLEQVVVCDVRGRLLRTPRGAGGFGYDPLFVPEGDTRTTAELPAAEKDALSHRGKALREIAPLVLAALRGRARVPEEGVEPSRPGGTGT